MLVVAAPSHAQSSTASSVPPDCKESLELEGEPFSLRDNVTTAVATSLDAGAALLLHAGPALLLVPFGAAAADAVLAGNQEVTLPVPRPRGMGVLPVLAATGVLLVAYASLAPAADGLILLGVRVAERQNWPSWRHAVAVMVASYLSLPVTLVGMLGVVTFVSIVTQPEPPSFLPTRETVPSALKSRFPTRSRLQGTMQALVFMFTVGAVLVLVRPLGLALFERAGSLTLPDASSAPVASAGQPRGDHPSLPATDPPIPFGGQGAPTDPGSS